MRRRRASPMRPQEETQVGRILRSRCGLLRCCAPCAHEGYGARRTTGEETKVSEPDQPGTGDTIWYRSNNANRTVCALVSDCAPDEFEVKTGAYGRRGRAGNRGVIRVARG